MPSPVGSYLQRVHDELLGMRAGEVADYIPALAAADPEPFGICLATVDGAVYAVGDADREFTIQSISKPFTYALAIADRGLDEVLDHIGVEPSGEAFNQISLDRHGRPRNPMINAGAIAAASLVEGADPFGRILDWYGRWAGRELRLDTEVYAGESETGHRNRAIAHLLRSGGVVGGDPERALDAYFRQCSVLVTARDLAVMAATLAARGRHPTTGETLAEGPVVDQVLSVMTTCGMYDGAGRWLVDVGMPAKSGVAGGVIGVLPGQLGIAVFSPRLDEVGNSARGVAAFQRIAADLQLHFLHAGRPAGRTVARTYSVSAAPSTRRRGPDARRALDAATDRSVVLEIVGEVVFSGAEAIARRVAREPATLVVLDLARATQVDDAATDLLGTLAAQLAEQGRTLVVAGLPDAPAGVRAFAGLDEAKEWCEDELLGAAGVVERDGPVSLDEHPLGAALTTADREALRGLAAARRFAPGEILVRRGDRATSIFALLDGEAEVVLPQAAGGPGGQRRLTTLAAGSTFGESAISGGARTADIVALTAGELLEIDTVALERGDPGLRAAIYAYLLRVSHEALERATRRIDALAT
ncbi:MAG: glutaminase A [Nocardioides sp.]|uniref:glutaminase A n=1 Tax=Nocardioides sp. TaxID=35761 RepID=UPI0039E7022E